MDQKFEHRWDQLKLRQDRLRHFVVGQRSTKEQLSDALSLALAAIENLKQFTTKHCEECVDNRAFADLAREEIAKYLPSEEENLDDLHDRPSRRSET